MNSLQEPAEFVVHRALEETVSGFNRAHLWFCDLDEDCQPEEPGGCWLSADERARAERLKSQLKRRRFVARCAFVRQVLGRLAGVAPAALEFRRGARGKPRLAVPADAIGTQLERIRFNLGEFLSWTHP